MVAMERQTTTNQESQAVQKAQVELLTTAVPTWQERVGQVAQETGWGYILSRAEIQSSKVVLAADPHPSIRPDHVDYANARLEAFDRLPHEKQEAIKQGGVIYVCARGKVTERY